MTENDAKRPEEEDDEDDWMKYATASFGETDYSLWDEVEPVEEEDEAYQQEVAMQRNELAQALGLGRAAQQRLAAERAAHAPAIAGARVTLIARDKQVRPSIV